MEDLFEAENDRFLQRITYWRITIPRCNHPDGTLKALPEVSNVPSESDSDTTAKNSQRQLGEEETPSKKRKIEVKAKNTTSQSRIAQRLGINNHISHPDTMDKFTAIKMRRSFEPTKTSTPSQRKNRMPAPLAIKAEPAVENVIQLDTTEVSQVPLTEAAPETVEPTTREQEEDVPEPKQSVFKEKINESTLKPIEPREETRESEAPQVTQETEDSTTQLQEATQTTTQEDATEPEIEVAQTTTQEDATEPEIEVEMQESAPEEAPAVENETQEPASEAAAAASADDVTQAVELRGSVSFSYDGQLPVIESLSQIDLFSDVPMNLSGSTELDTSLEFDSGEVDMNIYPQLDVANEEEVESSDIKTDGEYISDYKLKPVSVMMERVDPDKLRKILGHRMPDSHKVTKSGRVWKPKIIVDPSTSFQTRKNLKKRIDSKSSKALSITNGKQKRGRPGKEKKSDEHRSKEKKERPSKEMKSGSHQSKDKKEKKSEEKSRKEKKERPRQSRQDQFFEAPDEDFPVSEDIEEGYVDFSLGKTFFD